MIRQDPEDAGDWERWFHDPRLFRDCRFDPERGWIVPPGRADWFLERGLSATVSVPSRC